MHWLRWTDKNYGFQASIFLLRRNDFGSQEAHSTSGLQVHLWGSQTQYYFCKKDHLWSPDKLRDQGSVPTTFLSSVAPTDTGGIDWRARTIHVLSADHYANSLKCPKKRGKSHWSKGDKFNSFQQQTSGASATSASQSSQRFVPAALAAMTNIEVSSSSWKKQFPLELQTFWKASN